MGTSCSCFRQSSSSSRLSKEDLDDQNAGLTSSFIEFTKPGCLLTDEEEKNKQLHLQTQEQKQLNKASKERTLEDWLLASPGLNKYSTNNGASEYYVLMKNISHKVHPSLYEDSSDHISKSSEGLQKVEGELPKSQSGNERKKRVTFRLPEEADIFIFYSPAEQESGE